MRIKRSLDVALACASLLVLFPLLTAVAVAIAVEGGRPVLFRQTRVGRGGRPFQLLKFRSMRPNVIPVDELGQVRPDHELVTRVGRIIRRLKIDELPQLFNVLRGEMSLVGPRPTVESQVREYDHFQRRRLDVPPGMTGWAQINGNASLSWAERIELDVWYVDHWTLGLDLRTLLGTLRVVLGGEHPNREALEEAAAHANRPDRRS